MLDYVKEIIKDTSKIEDWSIEINPSKEGKLCQEIILALKNTMRENDLQYLTAPQIGYNRRIFCLRFGTSDYRTFINPIIENNVGLTISKETCASMPGKKYVIPRFTKVKFFYTTPLNKVESGKLYGRAALVFQHAMDHLNGLLVDGIGMEIDDDFESATTEEQEAILKMYAESLDLKQKDLEKDIQDNKELKDIDDAIKFITSVKDGETIIDVEHGSTDKKG